MFGDHGLGGLPEEGAHEKSPKCLGGNLGDFGEFCKGLYIFIHPVWIYYPEPSLSKRLPRNMNDNEISGNPESHFAGIMFQVAF